MDRDKIIDNTVSQIERQYGVGSIMKLGEAGATRLRPVMLTAITTILGLLPLVTGVSFDFHEMAMSLASESSQYWRSMAIVVIFGLIIATFLTLVVVPTLYLILATLPERAVALWDKIRKIYWKPFEGSL